MTGKLTSAISQLQAAVRAAEARSQDSPMDGTEASAAVEMGQAGATEPPADLGIPTMPLGRAAGQAFAFPAPVPQFSAAPALCFDNHFGAAPPLAPPAATLAPGHSPAPLPAAAAVVPEQELQARIRAETKKREQAERLSDEAAAKLAQAANQKRKVEELYKPKQKRPKRKPLQQRLQPSTSMSRRSCRCNRSIKPSQPM